MGDEESVNPILLAERLKTIRERLDRLEQNMADRKTVEKIEKSISLVQWGVGAAVLTSLMKLLGLG